MILVAGVAFWLETKVGFTSTSSVGQTVEWAWMDGWIEMEGMYKQMDGRIQNRNE